MSKRYILVHKMIYPPRTKLFNLLHTKLVDRGDSLHIVFTSKTESNRNRDVDLEKSKFLFEYTILESRAISSGSVIDTHYFNITSNFFSFLQNYKPDVVIHIGWSALSVFQAHLWCKKYKKEFILGSDSTVYETSWRRTITKPLIKYLVKSADKRISFGIRSKEYLLSLGAKEEGVIERYNTVDVDHFTQQKIDLLNRKESLRKKYSITTSHVLLFVGQFIKRKGVFELVEGFAKLQADNDDISLLFIGSGQEKKEMKRYIDDHQIKNVIFTGFVSQKDISEVYTIADIFILPSQEEVRGLVINEAMCFGLPIIAGYKVGATPNLVHQGKNGYIMNNISHDEVCKGVTYIIDNGLIKNNTSSEIIQKYTPEKFINNISF